MANGAPKICDGQNVSIQQDVKGCKGLCIPLMSGHKPSASEWYCVKCDISYDMTQDEINFEGRKYEAANARQQ